MPVLSATKRCRHVELEQFWQAFASRGFVSDSWAFLLTLGIFTTKLPRKLKNNNNNNLTFIAPVYAKSLQ